MAFVFFFNAVIFVGPPALLLWAMLARWKGAPTRFAPRWRVVLRDVSLAGVTLEWICNWAVFYWFQRYEGPDLWKLYEAWGHWAVVVIVSSAVFASMALLGKGRGRVPTILCAGVLVFGLLWVNP